MSVKGIRHQLQVVLEIPEARIEEWGKVRADLYAFFGAKLHVSDKAGEGVVKLTCTYTQTDDDLDKYSTAKDMFYQTITPITRVEGQTEMFPDEDEDPDAPPPPKALLSADDDPDVEVLSPEYAQEVLEQAVAAGDNEGDVPDSAADVDEVVTKEEVPW
jgi:hypothetical protein